MAGMVGVVAALAIWSAASANPQTMSISVSPDRGMPGTTVTANGAGCEYDGEPWDYVRIAFHSVAKKANGDRAYSKFFPEEHPVRPDGTWTGQFAVPADAPLGNYEVEGDCVGSDQVMTAGPVTFTVGEPLPPTTTTAAPPPTTEAATTTPPMATTTTAKPKAATTTTPPAAAAATTTTTQAAIATTTTEPPPGREVAAPASATKRASGTRALAAAFAAVLAASCGALAVRTARRRRVGEGPGKEV